MKNLIIRVISAVFLVPFGLFVLTKGGMPLVITLILLGVLGVAEGVKMLKNKTFPAVLSLILLVLTPLFCTYKISEMGYGGLLLATCFCIWGTDSFAFLVGKLLGRHKLAPSISPGKTWEGFFGGLVFGSLIPIFYLKFKPIYFFVMPLVSILTQISDLLESKFKRICGVKDSGCLIPGHGGILDRFDGFLLTMPFIFIIILLNKFGWLIL
jgi:CDP-diglyceride synthetase